MAETKRLFLLRHAKSSWDDPGLADHDRPLSARGRRAAKRMERHLHSEEISQVLCSSARRARETLELVKPSGEIHVEPELYGASAEELLIRLRHLPGTVDTVMLIGHNPAIQELAAVLDPEAELLGRKFPTGALATFTCTGPWAVLDGRRTKLAAFVTPRELE